MKSRPRNPNIQTTGRKIRTTDPNIQTTDRENQTTDPNILTKSRIIQTIDRSNLTTDRIIQTAESQDPRKQDSAPPALRNVTRIPATVRSFRQAGLGKHNK